MWHSDVPGKLQPAEIGISYCWRKQSCPGLLLYFSKRSGLPMFVYNINALQTLVFLDYMQY